ncbi:MAG: hypothetical protein ACRCS6_05330 [Turicibacter sp.]
MENKKTSYLVLGLCLGAALGIVYDNLAYGAGVGLAIGAGLDGVKSKNK